MSKLQVATAGISLLVPSAALASDFSIVMLLILVPFAVLAALIWATTWPTTKGLKPDWLRILIRSFGLCLILTPTFTAGGNGKMVSVALYDIVFSGLGGDSIYAQQAMLNVLILTPLVTALFHFSQRQRPTITNNDDE